MLLEVAARPRIEPATQVRPRTAWRAAFSFPVVLAVLLLVVTMFTIRSRFNDPDLWWHLKTGEIIWNTHHIPTIDTFSFTTNSHPYTPHEWLTQLTMYAAYHFGGYSGLMLWFSVLAAVLIMAGFALCAVYSSNVKVAFMGGLIIWLFSTIGLSIRPQMLGYLFLICELLILYLGRSRDRRWLLALPPMFVIWVNCHGSFLFGLIVLAIVLLCSFPDIRVGLLVSEGWEKRRRSILALAFVLSIAALVVNPVGLNQVVYALGVMTKLHINTSQVSEWQPPPFDDFRTLALFAVAGLILIVPLLRRAELKLEELILAAFGFGLAVRHERMLIVFGVLAAPVLCRLLATAWDRYEPDRDRPVLNAILIAMSLFIAVAAFPSKAQLDQQVENGNPVRAVEFMNNSSRLSGNMLNEYIYGGYLIWAAPQHKVFVDGRGDVFEWTGVLEDYGKWAMLETDPNTILDKYHINFCLLSNTAPMSNVLRFLPGWKTVYADEVSVIFARSNSFDR